MSVGTLYSAVIYLTVTISVFGGLKSLPFVTKNLEHYPEYEREALIGLIKESEVIAEANDGARLYRGMSADSGVVMLLAKGSQVEILHEQSLKWYFVKDVTTGKTGWTTRESLKIPDDAPADKTRMNKAQLEGYANVMGFHSKTRYFVLTDIGRQLTHVFKGSKHNWTLVKTMECSTGKNESPTVRGNFTIENRGPWFYSERLKSGGKYWVRFSGTYLFHSVAMDREGNVIDSTVGEKSSSGCIRFSTQDAEWFYLNVPDDTFVFVI